MLKRFVSDVDSSRWLMLQGAWTFWSPVCIHHSQITGIVTTETGFQTSIWEVAWFLLLFIFNPRLPSRWSQVMLLWKQPCNLWICACACDCLDEAQFECHQLRSWNDPGCVIAFWHNSVIKQDCMLNSCHRFMTPNKSIQQPKCFLSRKGLWEKESCLKYVSREIGLGQFVRRALTMAQQNC